MERIRGAIRTRWGASLALALVMLPSAAILAGEPQQSVREYIRIGGRLIAVDSTGENIPPSKPEPFSGAGVDTQTIHLTWFDSTDTGGSGLAGYFLYREGTLISGLMPYVGNMFNDVGLLPGTEYHYLLRAVDNAGNLSEPAITSAWTLFPNGGGSPPLGLVATSESLGGGSYQVNLAWNAATNMVVHHYQIERSYNSGTPTTFDTPNSAAAFTDTAVSEGIAYLYRVRAVDAANNMSSFTNLDLATTVAFEDDPVQQFVTVIKAQHLTQLRQAIDAVRVSAGLGGATWTDSPLSGVVVKKVHFDEMRAAVGEARTAIGISTGAYTDPDLTGAVVKKVHLEEVRQNVK